MSLSNDCHHNTLTIYINTSILKDFNMDKNEQLKKDDLKRSNTLPSHKERLNKHPQPKEHAKYGDPVFASRKVGRAHKHRLEDVPQTDDKFGDVLTKGRHYSEKPRAGMAGEPFGSAHGAEFHPDLKEVPHNPVDWSHMKPDAPAKEMPDRYSDSVAEGHDNPAAYQGNRDY
jgi:hypothetical protein